MNSQNNRIVEVDILRGLALFGVVLVNIFYFQVPAVFFDEYYAGFTDLPNRGAVYVMNWFFNLKFYPIFSFLFGMGIAIQFQNFTNKGKSPYHFLVRRLLFLFLFGLAHVIFIWDGDILLIYALFGFILLALVGRSSRVILASAVFFYFVPVMFNVFEHFLRVAPFVVLPEHSLDAYIQFYTQAPYLHILVERLTVYLQTFLTARFIISEFSRLAYFLLGAFVVRQNLLRELSHGFSYWKKAFLFSTMVFGVGFFIDKMWMNDLDRFNDPFLYSLEDLINSISSFFLVLAYLVGFLIVVRWDRIRRVLLPFSNMGKMTLTLYILHTLVYSFLFYSYGLRQYASLTPLGLFAVAIGYFMFSALVSTWWLDHFRYGPLEWIWRSLTYGKFLPLQKNTNA